MPSSLVTSIFMMVGNEVSVEFPSRIVLLLSFSVKKPVGSLLADGTPALKRSV